MDCYYSTDKMFYISLFKIFVFFKKSKKIPKSFFKVFQRLQPFFFFLIISLILLVKYFFNLNKISLRFLNNPFLKEKQKSKNLFRIFFDFVFC